MIKTKYIMMWYFGFTLHQTLINKFHWYNILMNMSIKANLKSIPVTDNMFLRSEFNNLWNKIPYYGRKTTKFY